MDQVHKGAPPTFAADIEAAACGQPIEAVVIEARMAGSWGDFGMDERHAPGASRTGEVLTWDVARPLLDYAYDTGYGSADCHDVTAWTQDRVLFVHEYDGSTHVASVRRNPPATGAPRG